MDDNMTKDKLLSLIHKLQNFPNIPSEEIEEFTNFKEIKEDFKPEMLIQTYQKENIIVEDDFERQLFLKIEQLEKEEDSNLAEKEKAIDEVSSSAIPSINADGFLHKKKSVKKKKTVTFKSDTDTTEKDSSSENDYTDISSDDEIISDTEDLANSTEKYSNSSSNVLVMKQLVVEKEINENNEEDILMESDVDDYMLGREISLEYFRKKNQMEKLKKNKKKKFCDSEGDSEDEYFGGEEDMESYYDRAESNGIDKKIIEYVQREETSNLEFSHGEQMHNSESDLKVQPKERQHNKVKPIIKLSRFKQERLILSQNHNDLTKDEAI
ncbi:hypothetical protein HDU92_002302 [Lobulomyces angularis]|nr:hypothetical protein HDU92_002302 [Lobulomyces angularis]